MDLMPFHKMSIELKNKIMYYCPRELKCQEGITTGDDPSGPMDSQSEFNTGHWDRFVRGEDITLPFNGAEGSNEEKMGREQKGEVL